MAVARKPILIDGILDEWLPTDRIDRGTLPQGYALSGTSDATYFSFALTAPQAIGANTTFWFDTDRNTATGYQIFGFAGGAEYNVNIAADGTAALYRGGAGETLVLKDLTIAYSADRKTIELQIPKTAIGNPNAVTILADVNDSAYLPGSYSDPGFTLFNDTGVVPDPGKRVGIVYSETTAKAYFSETAYSQLFMNAQAQVMQAGLPFDILQESDLTSLATLAKYDTIVFPQFRNVQASQVTAITAALEQATKQFGIGLVAAGEFMTNGADGSALPGDSYARMKLLFDATRVTGGFPADVTLTATDPNRLVLDNFTTGETIRQYTGVGWNAFTSVSGTGTTIATETIGGQTYAAAIATQTGGRNVIFSSEAIAADSNLLWQAVDYSVNGAGPSVGLQITRQTSVFASRNDMDQSQYQEEVNPEGTAAGIYDKLIPILDQWKKDYNFVGSYYVNVGNDAANGSATDWAVSGAYYKALIDMGNELGTHSYTHPDDTNTLTAEQIAFEFGKSKAVIEEKMSALLGRTFTIDGAAVPGAPETLATSLAILAATNMTPTNLVSNGDFSAGSAGWTNSAGVVEVYSAETYGITTPGAGNVLEVDVDAGSAIDTVSQTIATQAGQSYSFRFDAAQRAGTESATNTVEVLWNGAVIDTVTPTSTSFAAKSYTVTAVGATSTITFRELAGSDNKGGIIDNVAVTKIPTAMAAIPVALPDASFETVALSAGAFTYRPAGGQWSFSGGAGVATNGSAWGFQAAPNGTKVAFLQNVSAISQTLNGLIAGQTYTVTFDVSGRPNYGNNALTLKIDGQTILAETPALDSWSSRTATFVATAATGVLSFAGSATQGDNAIAIDNVAVTQTSVSPFEYMTGGYSGVGAGYVSGAGYLKPGSDQVYIAPNVTFDFTLVGFQGKTAAQAEAAWAAEWASLTAKGEAPIIVWPWHDYGPTLWDVNGTGAASPYTSAMFTNFIARAYAAGAEFVTLDDLAQRTESLSKATIASTVVGDTITATVGSNDAGRFALDVDGQGTKVIKSVSGWYAYDQDSVFLPANGGTFTITLGAAQDDVTHITALPMRASLISVSGDGRNLAFSVLGEGKVVVDLAASGSEWAAVTGATIVSKVGDLLTLDVGANGRHDVAIGFVANAAPVLTSNGGNALSLSIAENVTAVSTLTATDTDIASGDTLRFSISGGADAALFAIDATTGALTFKTAPDFEAPTDNGRNNTYDVIAAVTDSRGSIDTQALAVRVTDVAGVTRTGTSQIDNFVGTSEADTLRGAALRDTLNGGGGNDILIGGSDGDYLYGGFGNDTFRYLATGDSTGSGSGRDTIYDFVRGQDKIDLSAIDANTSILSWGDQAFTLLNPGASFTGAAQLRYSYTFINGVEFTIVQGNVNAGSAADFEIAVLGRNVFAASDFIL